MPSYINGIDTSLITGIGQIGITPTSPIVIPTSGTIGGGGYGRTALLSGGTTPPPDFYRLITGSTFRKIEMHSQAVYFLSSSGELFSQGLSSNYTGTGTTSFAKVTTGSNWTDISVGSLFAIGICDGKLFAIGLNSNGQFGNGGTTAIFNNFAVVNSNTNWTKISCGAAHSVGIRGGNIFTAGSNGNGRTGLNRTAGNQTVWSSISGALSSSTTGWTDCSAGNDFTLAISGNNLYGTGEAGVYQLGNNSTTDLLVFTLVSGSGIWSQSFAFGNFSKATTTSSFHYHAGTKAYVTGDGSTSGQFLTWTRVGTDNGWSYFAGEKLSTSTQYGTIGIRSGSLFYIGQNGVSDAWKPNPTFTGYISGSNDATWQPILTSSRRCTAAYVGGSITNATLIMSLQPL